MWQTIVLVIHLLLAIGLVSIILLQKSEGGALGIGGGSGSLFSARGAANVLTRATTILATAFVCTSITLAILAAEQGQGKDAVSEALEKQKDKPVAPAQKQAPAAPALPGLPDAK